MKFTFEEIKDDTILAVAKKMVVAARTAPKARGVDNVHTLIITGEEIKKLASHMKLISKRDAVDFFERDAKNLLVSSAVVLLGSPYKSLGLKNCQCCGFKTCVEKDKHPDNPCVYNVHDLGIAVGSAVSLAADNRIDNRVMFSVGKAALELQLFPSNIKIAFGIPLTAAGKNPFFDRKTI